MRVVGVCLCMCEFFFPSDGAGQVGLLQRRRYENVIDSKTNKKMSWHWPPRSSRIFRAKLSSRAFFSKWKKCATYLQVCWLVSSSGFGSEIESCDGKQSGKLFWKLELWPRNYPLQCRWKCHDSFFLLFRVIKIGIVVTFFKLRFRLKIWLQKCLLVL